MWESEQKYRIKGVKGSIIYPERSGVYFLKDVCGCLYPIDQADAEKIRARENSRGRPALFPGKIVKSYTITLPEDHWDKIHEPYSLSIARMISNESHKILG